MRARFLIALLAMLLLLAGCGGSARTLMHVHGLGYTPDGQQLYVPAHDGFRIYQDGRWQNPDLPRHDFMGFAATKDGFYSSGHPGEGSDLPNPLGLLFSPDWGKTLNEIGFRGEVDFHLTAAGYESGVFYVYNPTAQPNLPRGINRTDDRGQSWRHVAAKGVTGDLFHLAVHPTEPDLVALVTRDGLFLSRDGGETFQPVDGVGQVTSVAFHPDGKHLLFGMKDLRSLDLESGAIETLTAPELAQGDYLLYLAPNPARPDELAVATARRSLYLRAGEAWSQIAAEGKGR